MCDAYKFMDKYHVYRAENMSHRKQFIMDIGGEALWQHIGSHGWVSRSKPSYDPKGMMHVHQGGNHTVDVNATLFFGALHEKYRQQTLSFREHAPEILHFGYISDFNVSLLESSTFHARNAKDQLFEFYRSDLLAKAIAYYLSDYQMFKIRLPHLVCQYLQFDALIGVMEDIANYNGNERVPQKEEELKRKTNGIFGGMFSIYNPAVKMEHRGKKTIDTVFDTDYSESVRWNRDKWTMNTNLDTKILHFYEMMDFDDLYSDYVFGVRFSGIRGMAALVNVIAMIDADIWPIGERCFDLKRYHGNIRDTAHLEMSGISRVLASYFENMLPIIMENVGEAMRDGVREEIKRWIGVAEQDVLDVDGLDVSNVIQLWLDEDKKMFANIRAWQLYQRDVPRNLFWERRKRFKAHDVPWEI